MSLREARSAPLRRTTVVRLTEFDMFLVTVVNISCLDFFCEPFSGHFLVRSFVVVFPLCLFFQFSKQSRLQVR